MKPLEFVMLIDKDHESNEQAQNLLNTMGFARKVVLKDSGKDGIDYIRELIDSDERCPEIVFIDINLPIEGGVVFLYEFEKLVGELNVCTKVVVTTIHKQQRNIQDMITNGEVMGFLYKPYEEVSMARIHRTYQNYLR